MNQQEKLAFWQARLQQNAAAYSAEEQRMEEREALYRGEIRRISPLTGRDLASDGRQRRTVHLRNIVAENIETMVSSAIPQPKVTARRKEDSWRAKLLEDMLRAELKRLPFRRLNDQMERTVPIQGGALWLVEWDNGSRSHTAVGDVRVSMLHPAQVIPQDGVYTGVEDMDYILLRLPQTRDALQRRYGIQIPPTAEDGAPLSGAETSEELVTQYIAYYRDEAGRIGLFSWTGDTVLEDRPDYQARKLRRCADCGAHAAAEETRCPICGGAVAERTELYEELFEPVATPHGTLIPGAVAETDAETGERRLRPTRLPYYRPDGYPLILQKNISVYGRFLGDSDVDKIADQQNTLNRMETKVIDRLIKAGTRITLPDRADFRVDPEDNEKWYIGNAGDKAMIDVFQFEGNLQYEMAYLAQVYEEARQLLGITDSFQGREDSTAQSGVAKQFAASQSAGRLESRRVMKHAAYAELFRRIAQLKVAYADEIRPIAADDDRGSARYSAFSRYDFYEQDAAGEWYCILEDDRFLFECDNAAPLANNRERMWEDTALHLRSGAYGDPTDLDTLILYWSKLELLHYPGAGDTKMAMEERKRELSRLQSMEPPPGESGCFAGEARKNPEFTAPETVRGEVRQ